MDHVPRRFATPPCKIIPRSKLQPGSGLRIRDEDQTFRVQSQHRRQVRMLPTPAPNANHSLCTGTVPHASSHFFFMTNSRYNIKNSYTTTHHTHHIKD